MSSEISSRKIDLSAKKISADGQKSVTQTTHKLWTFTEERQDRQKIDTPCFMVRN